MIAMLAAGKIAAALAPQPVGTIAEQKLTSGHHRVYATCPIFGNLATAHLALVYPSLAQV